MKRDMDLIRSILQVVEACEDPYGLGHMPEIEGCSPQKVSYHVKLLTEAGFIEAHQIEEMGTEYDEFIQLNLTWAGQDFLAAASDDGIWTKAKKYVLKPGVSFTSDLLLAWLKMEAKQKLGIS